MAEDLSDLFKRTDELTTEFTGRRVTRQLTRGGHSSLGNLTGDEGLVEDVSTTNLGATAPSPHNTPPTSNNNSPVPPLGSGANSNPNSNPHQPRRVRIDMATPLPIPRFVGRIVDENDPEKARLESYTVQRFIEDVDCRIVSKNITEEIDKIKEAYLLVHPEKGNAKDILLTPPFTTYTTWAEYKLMCTYIWQRREFADAKFNLRALHTIKCEQPQMYVCSIISALERVKNDIRANKNVRKQTVAGATYIHLDDAVQYHAYGSLSMMFPREYQEVLDRSEIDPQTDLYTLCTQIEEKLHLKPERRTELTMYTQRGQGQAYPRRTEGAQGNMNRVAATATAARYGSQTSSPSQVPNRGRGSYSGAVRNRRPNCDHCGKTTHETQDCIQCVQCQKWGHATRNCYYRNQGYQYNQRRGSGRSYRGRPRYYDNSARGTGQGDSSTKNPPASTNKPSPGENSPKEKQN